MEYTTISEEELKAYEEKVAEPIGKPNWAKIAQKAKKDPTIFAKYYLGITPFHYQDQVLNDDSDRIIVCSSRQIGKSYVVKIKALHYAMYHPGVTVLVFSITKQQAMDFLDGMRDLIFKGQVEANRRDYADGSNTFKLDEDPAWILPEDIDPKKPNNRTEFHLTNGSCIKSLPAKDSARGGTADLVIVDEAAFVPDRVFDRVIEPTVRFTGGKIILLSTPNGQKGFFYRYFDPEDKMEIHEYTRYWWDWTICPNEKIKQMTEAKKASLDPISFAQEYMAQFVSDGNAFFQYQKVKEAIDVDLATLGEFKNGDVIAGIDFGVSKSETVVTLVHYDEREDTIKLVYQKAFSPGYDNANLIPYLENLMKDFNISQIVVDDCPQAAPVIPTMESKGWNVYRFDFKKEKVRGYFRFRAGINRRDDDMVGSLPRIRYPHIPQLVEQMLAMQIYDNKRGSYSIEKPAGGKDDRVDSFMLACFPLLKEEEKTEFRSWLV